MFGANEQEKAQYLEHVVGSEDIELFPILPDNVVAFKLFANCSTQWRVSPNGQAMGIEYTSLHAIMTMMRTDNPLEAFEKVQLIERGALTQMAETRSEKGH